MHRRSREFKAESFELEGRLLLANTHALIPAPAYVEFQGTSIHCRRRHDDSTTTTTPTTPTKTTTTQTTPTPTTPIQTTTPDDANSSGRAARRRSHRGFDA